MKQEPKGIVSAVAPTQPDESKTTSRNTNSMVHALLIGINSYASDQFPNLGGAVADMGRIKDFLVNDLQIRPDLIQELTDELATRQAIVQAIKDLALPANKVQKGDPILIYFAGHGSTVNAPKNWTTDPKIQVLVPHDGAPDGDYANNVISDRLFGSLLRQLADAKGDNITVILDCCHSTSGTRSSTASDEDERDLVPRGVEFKQASNPNAQAELTPMYEHEVELDLGIEGQRGLATAGKFLYAGMRSHVLLAACGEMQSALEKKGSGIFTTALLSLLKSKGINSHTYAEIIIALGNLAKGRQTPQCEGAHRHTRKLFDSHIHFRGQAPLHVHFDDAEKKYVISNGGEIHGIVPGTDLAIYPSLESIAQSDLPYIAVVDKVYTTSSTIRFADASFSRLPPTSVALPLRKGKPLGDLRVYFPDEDQFRFVHDAMKLSQQGDGFLWNIRRSEEDEATLGLTLGGESVIFHILDKDTRELGVTKLRVTTPPVARYVAVVLQAAAHYFFHAYRKPERPRIRDKVAMHVYELEETDDYDDDLRRVLRRVEAQSDLLTSSPYAASTGLYPPWKVVADDGETCYGVEIENNATRGLFLSMFYFDCGTLEIRQLYGSSTAAPNAPNLDAPLRGRSSFSLNYGNGGGEPLRFIVDGEEDTDVGLVRVFMSNSPFELNIEQNALETIRPSDGTRALADATESTSKAPDTTNPWDVLTLPVIQRKPLAS